MEPSRFSTEWIRHSLKSQYDYKIKIIDFAEQGMKLIGEILERNHPDMFLIYSLEFGFRGNAAFVYLNCPDDNSMDMYDKLIHSFQMHEDSEEYKLKQYFDITDFITVPDRMYPTVLAFRVDDTKA